MCRVRASTASSYSHLPTTLRATYSNTSTTPSPVLADVKNSCVPCSGGAGVGCTGDGVVHVVVAPAGSRTKRLGVIVCASEKVEHTDGFRRGERTGEWLADRDESGETRAEGGGEQRSEGGSEATEGGVGDERAVSNASKNDEEGVW